MDDEKCRSLLIQSFALFGLSLPSSSQFKPKELMEPQLFLLDVEIKCFHEVEFLTISVPVWLLSNTSRFVSFPFRNLEVKENRSHRGSLRSVLLA